MPKGFYTSISRRATANPCIQFGLVPDLVQVEKACSPQSVVDGYRELQPPSLEAGALSSRGDPIQARFGARCG